MSATTTKQVPSGIGHWIAFESFAQASLIGNVREACRRLRRLRAGWILPRAGQNGLNDSGLAERHLDAHGVLGPWVPRLDVLQALAAEGPVYPWIYVGAHMVVSEAMIAGTVEGFRALLATGLVAGIVIDVEAEWTLPGSDAMAARLVTALRVAFPGVWIAFSSFDNPDNFPHFPWGVFGTLDANLPQIYAYEHDDRGYDYWVPHVQAQWDRRALPAPVALAGGTYRPAVRGGKVLGPFDRFRLAQDVVHFLDLAHAEDPAAMISLYSLEAMPKEVFDAVVAWAVQHAPTSPGTPTAISASMSAPTWPAQKGPAQPIGVADRAEQEEREKSER